MNSSLKTTSILPSDATPPFFQASQLRAAAETSDLLLRDTESLKNQHNSRDLSRNINHSKMTKAKFIKWLQSLESHQAIFIFGTDGEIDQIETFAHIDTFIFLNIRVN